VQQAFAETMSDVESVKEEEFQDDDITNPDVLTKYRAAADIASRTFAGP